MQEIIQDAIKEMDEEIIFLKEKKKIIETMDWGKPVDMQTWSKICSTPIRGTHLLEKLVQSTFPEAINVIETPNHVKFTLYGFECKLPTYQEKGIYVDTSWYDAKPAPPIDFLKNNKMYKYFKRKDEGADWEELFDIRLNYQTNLPRCLKWLLWFGKYKWKDDHRESWEEEFKRITKEYDTKLMAYHDKMRKMYRRIEIFQDFLIPELSRFTEDIKPTKEVEFLCSVKQSE